MVSAVRLTNKTETDVSTATKRNTHQIRGKKTDCGKNEEVGERHREKALSEHLRPAEDSRPEENTDEEASKRRVQGLPTPAPSTIRTLKSSNPDTDD